MVNNFASKSRISTISQIGPRGTLLNSKNNETNTLFSKEFHLECFNKIKIYLSTHNYDHEFTKKILTSISDKEFRELFKFLISKSRPEWNYELTKIDEHLPLLLTEIRYPYSLVKAYLKAISTPGALGQILKVLAWLVEINNASEIVFIYFNLNLNFI